MRTFFVNRALGILAVVLAAGILLIAVSFLMFGVATGLGTAFVSAPWLGWVITGCVFLLGPLFYLKVHFSKTKKAPSDLSKVSETLQKIIEVAHGIDIREWTRNHPYQSTGAAAAAGFIAGGKEPSDIADILKIVLPLVIEHLQASSL